jgi:hypothetical protein
VEDDVKGLAEAMLICFDFAPPRSRTREPSSMATLSPRGT